MVKYVFYSQKCMIDIFMLDYNCIIFPRFYQFLSTLKYKNICITAAFWKKRATNPSYINRIQTPVTPSERHSERNQKVPGWAPRPSCFLSGCISEGVTAV
jgi:hypothetical protein